MSNADCTPSGATAWEGCNMVAGQCERLMAVPDDFGEERGRWEGTRPFEARRWLVRILDGGTGTEVLWGWAPLDELGCTGEFDDAGFDTLRIDRMRWTVSPEGNSVLGSTEQNWGIALRLFLLSSGDPGVPLVGGMLPAVHADGGWVPSGNNNDFEIRFDEVMDPAGEDYLGSSTLYNDWTDLAIEWELRDETLYDMVSECIAETFDCTNPCPGGLSCCGGYCREGS